MRSSAYFPLPILAGLFLIIHASTAQSLEPLPVQQASVVYSIDGSGGLRAMAQDMSRAIEESNLNCPVEAFNWSHGAGRILADLHGQSHHKTKGQELAAAIQSRRSSAKIFLVSHSSGAAVALAAAESLPEGSIERIILLTPAISQNYDLRPALRCSRQGIDVFYSHKDMISASLTIFGTADGRFFSSAGAGGFRVVASDSADRALYANLRQTDWANGMGKTGNNGGHFGFTSLGFLKAYVVPLLTGSPTNPPAATEAVSSFRGNKAN